MKGGPVDRNLNTKLIELFDCLKYCDWKYKNSTYSKFPRKIIKDNSI